MKENESFDLSSEEFDENFTFEKLNTEDEIIENQTNNITKKINFFESGENFFSKKIHLPEKEIFNHFPKEEHSILLKIGRIGKKFPFTY